MGHTLEPGEAMAQVIMEKAAMPEVVENENRQGHPERSWWIWLNHWVRPHR